MQNPPTPLTDELHALADAGRPDGFRLLEQVEAQAGDQPAVRELLDAMRRWLLDPALPLHVRLGLPATPGRRRRYLRDLALREAAKHLDAAGPWSRALALEREWRRFTACPAWTLTLDRREPPPELTSPLRISLWWATKHSGGEALDARRLSDILRAT